MNNLAFLIFLSLMLLLTGCVKVTSEKQESCLKYKYTKEVLIEYSLYFYPDIEIPDRYKKSRQTIKGNGVEKNDIKDGWGNYFLYSDDGRFVYSVGINEVDERGMGDDIKVEDLDNKINYYCD